MVNIDNNTNCSTTMKTYFAPAERDDNDTVMKVSKIIESEPIIQAILESVDGYIMVLNSKRQVLAMNKQLVKDLKIETPSCLFGNRPGEILGCIHSAEMPGGCGTSKVCSTCGAVISIVTSQKENKPITKECLATIKSGTATDSLEFRVKSTPIEIGGQSYTVLVLNDISGDKRRDALERTFFHDILNTVGGLLGWSSLLRDLENLDPKEVASHIVTLSRRLQQEIEDQRKITHAEKGDLNLTIETVSISDIFNTLNTIFQNHPVAENKTLLVLDTKSEEKITADISLLTRILTNMVKNALEAINIGETVKLWYEKKNGNVIFYVHNPGFIPEHISMRIFKRSFSTKSERGRGIGTYSMKLFGERYLKGKVDFETSKDGGTTFYIQLPENYTK